MRAISSVYLISPISEFHCYASDQRLTDALFRALKNSLFWASDILRSNGIVSVTVLEIAAFPEDAHASEIRFITSDKGWEERFLESSRNVLMSVDALCLMPDVKNVDSPLMERIRDIASEMGKPEIDAYSAAGVDDSDFHRNLMLIDDASMHSRERSKIIMRGGRGR